MCLGQSLMRISEDSFGRINEQRGWVSKKIYSVMPVIKGTRNQMDRLLLAATISPKRGTVAIRETSPLCLKLIKNYTDHKTEAMK